MAKRDHEGTLGAVYQAKRPEELAALYDGWSHTYEDEMARAGYRHPTICAALVARHVARGAAPLLDAGAGTGLLGEWLQILGYPHVEALDLSQGMLAKAAAKGVYAALHRLALGGPLPFADDHFAAIVSAGVFTTGHVGPEGLDELIRICRSGGAIVLTVKDTIWGDGGFAARIGVLENAGKIARLEETAPYVSMPGDPATVPSRAVVLNVR